MKKKNLMNIQETAEYLGTTKGTLYSWCHQKKIPYVKICGRTKFDLRELNNWIEEHSINPREY